MKIVLYRNKCLFVNGVNTRRVSSFDLPVYGKCIDAISGHDWLHDQGDLTAPRRITKHVTGPQATQDRVQCSEQQRPIQAAHRDVTAVCKDGVTETDNPHGYRVNFYRLICISVCKENYVHTSVAKDQSDIICRLLVENDVYQ